ncbi:response regulator [Pseudobdellovibrio sp. HCB154]|uniref:response regulator n=1 Tax=Pseudobdellovibrio sp. HCB154 TaxID=3386277 RepID=UPI00391755FA
MQAGPTILVMDDDIDLLEVLQETLVTLCKVDQVITATSMESVQQQKDKILNCELAILDVNLGAERPSGVNVAEWLRANGFKGKIVFLTGHAVSDPEVLAATRMPNTKVVAKPIGLPQLLGFVEGIHA